MVLVTISSAPAACRVPRAVGPLPGGMTNGAGVMEFNRGFAPVGAPIAPVALRCTHALVRDAHAKRARSALVHACELANLRGQQRALSSVLRSVLHS